MKEFPETIKCWACEEIIEMDFHRVYTHILEHWAASCPACGANNYIERPDWDKEFERVKS